MSELERQALVGNSSPKAAPALDSLSAQLRAAVPRLHHTATPLGQELDLVRADLELMRLCCWPSPALP